MYEAPIWTRQFNTGHCPCGSRRPAPKCCYRGGRNWFKNPAELVRPPRTDFDHPRCYLNRYGNCSRTISGEHIISRSLLKEIDPTGIKISGAPWLEVREEKILPLSALRANILCENHNSQLSKLDQHAGRYFAKLITLSLNLARSERRPFSVFSGNDLERWSLKVLCGALAARNLSRERQIITDSLDPRWLDLILGVAAWPERWGLYMHVEIGSKIDVGKTFNIAPITVTGDRSNALGGLTLTFAGFRCALVVNDFLAEAFRPQDWKFHMSGIKTTLKGKKAVIALTF